MGTTTQAPSTIGILGSAKSDGAFYTNNVSALMLARLALDQDFVDWTDDNAVGNLRIIDPACGTGTLLMGRRWKTIKDRMKAAKERTKDDEELMHRTFVEDVLCGLDINRHGVQLAACNLTLGAPGVDYTRMNLHTMKHGPQEDGSVPGWIPGNPDGRRGRARSQPDASAATWPGIAWQRTSGWRERNRIRPARSRPRDHERTVHRQHQARKKILTPKSPGRCKSMRWEFETTCCIATNVPAR